MLQLNWTWEGQRGEGVVLLGHVDAEGGGRRGRGGSTRTGSSPQPCRCRSCLGLPAGRASVVRSPPCIPDNIRQTRHESRADDDNITETD